MIKDCENKKKLLEFFRWILYFVIVAFLRLATTYTNLIYITIIYFLLAIVLHQAECILDYKIADYKMWLKR